jgi:hypothetical protein
MASEPRRLLSLFSIDELNQLEQHYPTGISAPEIITLFQSRGIKLSEATFRKYIQLGLLPTSRRVGRKGKHRGSCGVYPASVLRRINLIKSMMQEDRTLAEIRESIISLQNDLERLSDAIQQLFARLMQWINRLDESEASLQAFNQEVTKTHQDAIALFSRLEKIGSRLAVAGTLSPSKSQGGFL